LHLGRKAKTKGESNSPFSFNVSSYMVGYTAFNVSSYMVGYTAFNVSSYMVGHTAFNVSSCMVGYTAFKAEFSRIIIIPLSYLFVNAFLKLF